MMVRYWLLSSFVIIKHPTIRQSTEAENGNQAIKPLRKCMNVNIFFTACIWLNVFWCELMLLSVSLLKPLKYPLLMLWQCLHHWLHQHRGRSESRAKELCRPSFPSAHSDTQTGCIPEYDCRDKSHEWKSELEIHSRLAFRVHCPWQWVSHLSAVQVRKTAY